MYCVFKQSPPNDDCCLDMRVLSCLFGSLNNMENDKLQSTNINSSSATSGLWYVSTQDTMHNT